MSNITYHCDVCGERIPILKHAPGTIVRHSTCDQNSPPFTAEHVERLARLLAAGAGLTRHHRNFAPSARAYLNAAFGVEGETE